MRFWEERAFSEAVEKHFAFLRSEFGFQCTRAGDTYAYFRSKKVYVHIVYYSGFSHISIEIGHRYLPNRYYDALELLKFKDAPVNKSQFEVKCMEHLGERMEKIAGLIRRYLAELLRGDTGIFKKMRIRRRNVISFSDYYFQRLGLKKQYYTDKETGRRYTETGEHSAYGLLYTLGVIACVLAGLAMQIPPGYYSLILCLGVLLYPFKYFFTTFEEYMDPEDEERYRYW